jgi:xanthine dehydrogenase accessory factor
MSKIILLRGGGDLASGVALRLFRSGIIPFITEMPKPLMVRRLVSFADAVYRGDTKVEGVGARLVNTLGEAQESKSAGIIPVLVNPHLSLLSKNQVLVLIDARMTKQNPSSGLDAADLVIGLGPGFVVGEHCHAVVETKRGHQLGRVYWEGSAQADTGIPGSIAKYSRDRVLRAPADGNVRGIAKIGDQLKKGDLIAEVNGKEVHAPFEGVLRGLIHPSADVVNGMKIADLDPRNDPSFVHQVSDKAMAIGGAVLEALLSQSVIRERLWA